jgi:hypothetical protein
VDEKVIKIWLAVIGIASVGAIGVTIAPTLQAQSPAATIVATPQIPPTAAVVIPAPQAPTPATTPAQPDYFLRAKQAMTRILKDPDSARFANLFEGRGSSGRRTICGEINAKNGFGGYTGMNPFIYFVDTNEAFTPPFPDLQIAYIRLADCTNESPQSLQNVRDFIKTGKVPDKR